MNNTGLIKELLSPTARRIFFGDNVDDSIDADLPLACKIDQAHLVMLCEQGIVRRAAVATLLGTIEDLQNRRFSCLRGQEAPRGWFLLYENHLMEKCGRDIGGILQTARSRNDLNATLLRLRLRNKLKQFLREAIVLQGILLGRARRFRRVVMPLFTHYQPAIPGTLGHYLLGTATAFQRDVEGLLSGAESIHDCPLGAGSAGGTEWPILPGRTAQLLGFKRPVFHALDAVASRDLVLRILASVGVMGVTLSRLATDLLSWLSNNPPLLKLPDRLVGSSSLMPQKRNPFLLESVQGSTAGALGAFVAAAGAMRNTPFSNSVAVGTEGVKFVWEPLQTMANAITLMRLVIAGVTPQDDAMLVLAERAHVTATALANILVREKGLSFRDAHHAVGRLVRRSLDRGDNTLVQTASDEIGVSDSVAELNATNVAMAAEYGGGPGAQSFDRCFTDLKTKWAETAKRLRAEVASWEQADQLLRTTVATLGKEQNHP